VAKNPGVPWEFQKDWSFKKDYRYKMDQKSASSNIRPPRPKKKNGSEKFILSKSV
jgi:hypothetical protein